MWYDFFILAIMAWSIFRGAVKGIVWQLASIGSLVLCFVFATRFSVVISPYIGVTPPLNRWIAMLVVYGLFSFASFAVARVLRSWIEKARFVEYDRHLGAILGFVKGATVCLVLTFFAVTLSQSARGHIFNSYSGYAAAVVMDRLHPVMPDELHEVLEPYIHQLDRSDLDLKRTNGVDVNSRHTDGEDESNHLDVSHGTENSEIDGRSTADNKGAVDSAGGLDELTTLVESLPGAFNGNLRSLVLKALQNTEEKDRSELMSKLRSEVPGLIRMIANEWQDGKPPESIRASNEAEQSKLLNEIGAVYSDFAEAQETVVEEIQWAFFGVPDQVTLAVLKDWHSDLLALKPDPEPTSDMTTSLDSRILKQLSKANVPLTSLSSSLRNRLRESRSR